MHTKVKEKANLKRGIVAYILSVISLTTAGFLVVFAASPGFRYHTARYAHIFIDSVTEPSAAELEARLTELDAEIASKPDDPGPLVEKADTLVKLARHREALGPLETALGLDPDNRRAIVLKARVLAEEGTASEAVKLLEDATGRLDGFPEADYYESELLMKLGRTDEALAEIDEALAETPGDVGYMNRRADILLTLGLYDKALWAYDKTLEAMPDTPFHDVEGRTARATIQYARGIALNGLGRYEEALMAAELADKAVPNEGFSLDNRIYAHAGLGEFDEAAVLFETNIANWDMRNSATVYGYAVKMRGNADDERRMHLAVDQISQNDPTARRVYALAVLGENENALAAARVIITDRPWMARVMAARLELRELIKTPDAKAVFGMENVTT